MSAKSYSRSERGGGTGETGRRRAAILNQISTWWIQATWHDQERADRVFEKMQEAPESFITPDPDADYQEEAKRCYEAIKEEYGLRTEREAEREAKVWEAREERYIERKKREMEAKADRTPEPEPDPEPAEAPEAEADPAAQDWGSLEPETPASTESELEPAEAPAEFEGSSLALLARLFAGAAREVVEEFARGARAVGSLIRFAATGS